MPQLLFRRNENITLYVVFLAAGTTPTRLVWFPSVADIELCVRMYEYNKAAIEIEIVWLKVVKEPSGRFLWKVMKMIRKYCILRATSIRESFHKVHRLHLAVGTRGFFSLLLLGGVIFVEEPRRGDKRNNTTDRPTQSQLLCTIGLALGCVACVPPSIRNTVGWLFGESD